MKALNLARPEMETITAELRLRKALLLRILKASSTELTSGQKLLIYREYATPHCIGPMKSKRIEEEQIYLDMNGRGVQHSITQVKPYLYIFGYFGMLTYNAF